MQKINENEYDSYIMYNDQLIGPVLVYTTNCVKTQQNKNKKKYRRKVNGMDKSHQIKKQNIIHSHFLFFLVYK